MPHASTFTGEILEKVTRVLTEEEKAQLETEFVGKNGQRRKLDMIMGRQKLKKSLQYEIKWRGKPSLKLNKRYAYVALGLDHKFNTWIPREELIAKGFTKVVQQFDDLESSREGAGQRDTAAHLVRKHLEDIGLDGDIAQYNEISGLSGGPSPLVEICFSLQVTHPCVFRLQGRRSSWSLLLVYGITLRYVPNGCRSNAVKPDHADADLRTG